MFTCAKCLRIENYFRVVRTQVVIFQFQDTTFLLCSVEIIECVFTHLNSFIHIFFLYYYHTITVQRCAILKNVINRISCNLTKEIIYISTLNLFTKTSFVITT